MILIAMIAAASFAADPAVAPAPAPQPKTSAAAPAPAAKRYCIVDTFTGSRIPNRICRTRSQWHDLGTDLPADK